MIAMIGALLAAVTVYLWLPGDAVARLQPPREWALPTWAQARPGALSARVRWWLAAGAGVAWVWFVWDWWCPMALLLPLVVGVGWVVLGKLEGAGAAAERQRRQEAIPVALDLMRLSLGAGQSLRTAVRTVESVMGSYVGSALDQVTCGIEVGLTDARAWQALADDAAWGAVARDVARASEWGLPVADILAQHATSLRRGVAAARLASAKAVGVKAVAPLGLCYLPAFVCLGVVPIVAGGIAQVFR